MEVEAQESNSQNDAVVSSSCEIIFALKQEALFFVESHNSNPHAAVSTFQDNNAAVLATAAELGVENHDAGADVADAVETESNVAEQEKHTNLRTQDPPPERSMEASCTMPDVEVNHMNLIGRWLVRQGLFKDCKVSSHKPEFETRR
ncbi:hypothetical protein ACFX2C_014640 [Malus domestica]